MKIWILNHYATDMYLEGIGRHQGFAKYLIKDGHDVKIFCASTVHNSDINVDTKGKKYIELIGQDNVPYIMIKTSNYVGNGKQRIKNMIEFYLRIFGVMKEEIKRNGKPDIILASSVHPLTLVAGIQFAKKIKCPCICEVRDLWPESIVVFTSLTEKNVFVKLLYKLERWIYKKADALIFTMEGGYHYITDKNWHKDVNANKVFHINNGVDLELYKKNLEVNTIELPKTNKDSINIVYAGSIRSANNVINLAYAAKKLWDEEIRNVDFYIYGDGPDKPIIEKYIEEHKLENIKLMGKVEKKYIPSVLSMENSINCLNYQNATIFRYGGSQNKLFEYLASGKPVLANVKMGYDIIEKYNAGFTAETDDLEGLIKEIIKISKISKTEYEVLSNNCKTAAIAYDYRTSVNKLTEIIKTTISNYGG